MSDTHLPGYTGRYTAPRKGTPLRMAFDAAHTFWCGPDCPPSCQEWQPNVDVLEASIRAYGLASVGSS